MRSLGKLNRVSDAEAMWHDCQMIMTVVAMHTKVHCIHRVVFWPTVGPKDIPYG